MKSWVFAVAMLVLVVPEAGVSATYYIDFASGSDSSAGTSKAAPWKRAPEMNGFAGTYTHSAGDHFIFKGGVTWNNTIAQWKIANSGASGNPDYYGVDKTWYNSTVCGSAWCQPIFDGGSQNPIVVSSGYWLVTGNYVTLDSLTLQNIGVAGINQGNYAIWLQNGHDILIENMTLPVMSRVAILIVNATGTTLSNYEFKNNNISACSWGIGGGPAHANSVMQNILIHDNTFHDFHPQMANSVHGDAIFLYPATSTDETENMDGVYIYNNVLYGDFSKSDTGSGGMGCFIRENVSQGSHYWYNNHSTYSAGGLAGVYWVGGEFGLGSVYIYNNSHLGDANTVSFLNGSLVANLVAENNIEVGGQYAYMIGAYGKVTNFISDYNDIYNWAYTLVASINATIYRTYAQLHAPGYEAHGLNANPLFVSSTNLYLLPGSPAISAGTNLSSVFTTDAAGKPRPSSGPWSMGAYQSTPPNPPTNLTATPH